MDIEILNTIIPAASVAAVSIVASILQYKTTKIKFQEEISKLEKEHELQLKKIRYDDKKETVKAWKQEFFMLMMELILETDIEVTKEPDQKRIVTLIQKLQFMLRPSDKFEEELMRQITGIGLCFSNYSHQMMDQSEYYKIHSQLSDLGRKVFYQQDEKI